MKKLDYTLTDVEDRLQLVREIIDDATQEKRILTQNYLDILCDYVVKCGYSIKEKEMLTENRMVTVNRREVSMEHLQSQFLLGESQLHSFFKPDDKGIIFYPKIEITEEDIKKTPYLDRLVQDIKNCEDRLKSGRVRGKNAYILKKQIIEMRKDQYILKEAFNPRTPHIQPSPNPSMLANGTLKESRIEVLPYAPWVIETTEGVISLFDKTHVANLLKYYGPIKEQNEERLHSDLHWTMMDLENLIDEALKDEPLLMDVVILKIDGLNNNDIVAELERKYKIENWNPTYISSLFIHRIPNLIVEQSVKNYLDWYFTTQVRTQWKTCSRCGSTKPAHPYYFTKNNTSKDGFYSLCKDCRHHPSKKKYQVEMR